MIRKTICKCGNDTYEIEYNPIKKLYFWECCNCGKKKYIYKRTTIMYKKYIHNTFYYECKFCPVGKNLENRIDSNRYKYCPFCGKRIISYDTPKSKK